MSTRPVRVSQPMSSSSRIAMMLVGAGFFALLALAGIGSGRAGRHGPIGPALLAVMFGFWVYREHASPAARAQRAFGRTVATPIAALSPGQTVKVVGRLVLGEAPPLVAPLTGRSCALYVASASNLSSPRGCPQLAREEKAQDFWLEDGTGRIRVTFDDKPLGLFVVADSKLEPDLRGEPPPILGAFLARHGWSSKDTKTWVFHEGVLEAGETVAVRAKVKGGVGYRDAETVLTRPEDDLFLVSDDERVLRAGKLS